jgi:hypothetical protein
LLGSCFAENIGEKLTKNKFPVCVNPFGILFNPASIAQSLNRLTNALPFQESDLFFHNNEWICFSHHGKFSHSNKEKCLQAINEKLVEGSTFLQKADWLILTFGTSIAYCYKGNIVANCHKVPQMEFQTQILDVQDIVSELTNSIEKVKAINKNIRIIFSVSPIRHIRDNLTENSLSKARLIVAAHELVRRIENSDYFPAYEVMMDDLRDYRFYNEDMLHPSPLAINYIWKAFSHRFFDKETLTLNYLIEKIVVAKNHRLKNPFSIESKQFKEEQLHKIEKILSYYPYIDFESEIKYFMQ